MPQNRQKSHSAKQIHGKEECVEQHETVIIGVRAGHTIHFIRQKVLLAKHPQRKGRHKTDLKFSKNQNLLE